MSIAFRLADKVELTILGAARRVPAGVDGVRAPVGVDPGAEELGLEGGFGREALRRCKLFMGNFVLVIDELSMITVFSTKRTRSVISGDYGTESGLRGLF